MKKSATFSPGKVYLTDRALADLVTVESYSIATWGKSVAKSYLLRFEKAFRLIEANPDRPLPNPLLHKSLLFYRVEKHVMACVKIKSGIAVLTIAHANRDLVTLLHELTPTLREESTILLKRIEGDKS